MLFQATKQNLTQKSSISVGSIMFEGNKVAIRGKTTMLHKGEFQGIPPTGKYLELLWLDIMHIENGKNAEEWLSMDLMVFMQQLKA